MPGLEISLLRVACLQTSDGAVSGRGAFFGVILWPLIRGKFFMQHILSFETPGRGTRDITADVGRVVSDSGLASGVCHVFIRHTSASLMICENADPDVREDVERWMARAVVDGDAMFEHDMEGPDDMPGHIRSILTGSDLSVPVTDGALNLGTWQGIYLYEHRSAPHRREVVVTLLGAVA